MSAEEFDLVILGGGPAGYLAAERAGARGKKAVLIEKEHLGGVCLNRGCIPTKSLLNSAKLYHAAEGAEKYGVSFQGRHFDLQRAMAWKQQVMETLRKGVAYQMRRHGVEVVRGFGRLEDSRTISVEGKRYRGKDILIATGSSPARIPIPGADLPHVMTSAEILSVDNLPRNLVVIGGLLRKSMPDIGRLLSHGSCIRTPRWSA